MRTPSEHKTVQAHILKYAEEIGRALVRREEAEERRGFDFAYQDISNCSTIPGRA